MQNGRPHEFSSGSGPNRMWALRSAPPGGIRALRRPGERPAAAAAAAAAAVAMPSLLLFSGSPEAVAAAAFSSASAAPLNSFASAVSSPCCLATETMKFMPSFDLSDTVGLVSSAV